MLKPLLLLGRLTTFAPKSVSNISNCRFYSSFSSFIYYVNGNFLPADLATLSVRDLGLLRGYGCFDYFRTYNNVPLTLSTNVSRLRRSCSLIDLDLPYTQEELELIVVTTLQSNAHVQRGSDKGVRIVASGGVSSTNIIPDAQPSLVVIVEPLSVMPPEAYQNGKKVITISMGRLFPNAKTTNYIPAIIAQKKAKQQGAIEAIYITTSTSAQQAPRTIVLEGTTSNIFAFQGDLLVTPSIADNTILPGITRSVVIRETREKGRFDVQEREMTLDELRRADEVFMTGSNKRVMPVVQVDERIINNGKVGHRTKEIMKLFDDWCYNNRRAEE